MSSTFRESNVINYGIAIFKKFYLEEFDTPNGEYMFDEIMCYREYLIELCESLSLYETVLLLAYLEGICNDVNDSINSLSRLLVNNDEKEVDKVSIIFKDIEDSIQAQIDEKTAELEAITFAVDIIKSQLPLNAVGCIPSDSNKRSLL